MYFGMKEVLLYGSIALVAALFANHYASLNVPFLNMVEDSIIGEGDPVGIDEEDSSTVFDYANIDVVPGESRGCVNTKKMAGDAKMQIRSHMEQARRDNDEDTILVMEDKLQQWRDRISAACTEG